MMAHSPLPQGYVPLPEVDTDFDQGYTWSDVEYCIALIVACMRQPDFCGPVELPAELANLTLPNIGCDVRTYVAEQVELQHVLYTQTLPLNPRRARPTLQRSSGSYAFRNSIDSAMSSSSTSSGHRASRHLDQLYAASRNANTQLCVRRPRAEPPTKPHAHIQVKKEHQAESSAAKERQRRARWQTVGDSWPSFGTVVTENISGFSLA